MNPMSNQTIAGALHREYENQYGTPNRPQTSRRRARVIGIMATLICILAAAGLFL